MEFKDQIVSYHNGGYRYIDIDIIYSKLRSLVNLRVLNIQN